MAAIADRAAGSAAGRVGLESTHPRHTRRALSAARGHLEKTALKLAGWLAFGYLTLRLLPGLKHALRSLEHVSVAWVSAAVVLETLSEFGYVLSWRSIVDPEKLLGRDGRGTRTSTRAAWAQLGGGIIVPGGSLASVGVGAWILRRLGMPAGTIAERQFNLSFLNTAVDALVLVLVGVGLATGILGGERNVLLTAVPAACAAVGITAALLVTRRAAKYGGHLKGGHPKLAGAISSLAAAVDATYRIIFRRADRGSLVGAVAYLLFDNLVLWTAFFAIHDRPVPGYGVVVMAYIIGALGGSIPLPAGIGALAGIAGMLIVYGVGHDPAVAAVLLYEAVGLLVPLVGGGLGYVLLRHELGPMRELPAGDG